MAWPIPSFKTIAERWASTVETRLLLLRPDISAVALSRAVRSARGVLSQVGRAFSAEAREVHDHVAYWARQYFVDTAEDEMILQHAGIWEIAQRAATKALGTVTVEGVIGTALPEGLALSASDATRFVTTATATIGEDGTVDVAVEAVVAGSAANIEAGIRLTVVEPFPEVTRVTVASDFAGGANEQTLKELQSAVLAHIRQRPHGGAGFDYLTWLGEAFAVKAVSVKTDWIGRGSVGLIVAMKNDDGTARAPTEEELDAMETHLGAPLTAGGVRPVTAYVVMVAAELHEIDISVRLRPDTTASRAAVTEAFARYIATIGDTEDTDNASPIGAIIEPSRLSEAISAADGEYAHDLVLPAARYVLAATKYPVAGEITWVAGT